jgi:aminopeptidase-like protein
MVDRPTPLHSGAPLDLEPAGLAMHDFISDLYPMCRSITGNGVRETLGRIAKRIPLEMREIPSGTEVFDWRIPPEWNIEDAYIRDPRGRKIIDFADSNLHVVGYSTPIRAHLPLAELKEHLHSHPERSDWIPFRTSYYAPAWGFCVTRDQLEMLEDGVYEVVIDSKLADGHLTYGECLLEGESEEEVLVSTHVCHPSLCNDNLSGIALATFLAERLAQRTRRYSYRFVFVPGTIGSLAWLWEHQGNLDRVAHGLVLACLGDPGGFTYKRSRRANASIDRVVEYVLASRGEPHRVLDFSPWGYDERQYCSPGFDLPVGCLMRTPESDSPEYHSSADDLDFVRPRALGESLAALVSVVDLLEANLTYLNRSPRGEPQLGKRGLYSSVGGRSAEQERLALLWVLNQSDGHHSLLDIAERSGLPFESLQKAAESLAATDLLEPLAR